LTSRWTKIGELTVKRRCFGVTVVNDILYVIGGRSYDYPFPGDGYFTVTEQALTQQYTPIGYGTPDLSYDGTAPIIGLVSPENKTYYESKLPLNFTVDNPDCWLSYELDGGAPVDVSGNTTLSGLSFGSHNLTLYAIDGVGNTANQSTIFTLAEPETPSEPFPVVPVAVIVVIVVAVGGAGLLLYYRRHRKGSGRR